MNKLLFALAFTFIVNCSFAQTFTKDSILINEKAVQWFKSDYVEKTFKDPYSFKLLKVSNTPITNRQWILNNLISLDKTISTYESKKKLDKYEKELYDGAVKRKTANELQLKELSPEIADKIKCYKVNLDCYGANSTGNSVLGRYSFNYFQDQNPPVSYVDKTN